MFHNSVKRYLEAFCKLKTFCDFTGILYKMSKLYDYGKITSHHEDMNKVS